VVVLDPPKLAPSRKALPRALPKYTRLNQAAMRVVRPGGLLLTCSCSSAVTTSNGELLNVIKAAAAAEGREVSLLAESGAAVDHPVSLAYPESAYLTALLLSVT
jgi:23S rRNA G2069 N7-methylase RlmK/C1962 C5-methylase RlmI